MQLSNAARKLSGGNISLAEDIQQESNMSMAQGNNFYEAKCDAIDWLRRYTRYDRKSAGLIVHWPDTNWFIDPDSLKDNKVTNNITVQQILDCWSEDSQEYKMLELYFLRGFTYNEIGEMFERSLSWARLECQDAIEGVKEKLGIASH